MQKSKKMMVSLCGLALSSLFVLNNKSVVHADTVDGSQNNAITWDSDDDDSQVVSDTQIKTEQSMPQKVDDNQQNVQSVTANHADNDDSQVVQSAQTKTEQLTPQKADDNQQNVQSVQPSRAEIATVTSSSEQNNRTNTKTAQQAPVQVKQKVASVQDAQAVKPAVIKNPAGNKVHVNWVNSKGEAIPDTNGYDIDLSTVGTQSEYQGIPDNYHLRYPNIYNVTPNMEDTTMAATLTINSGGAIDEGYSVLSRIPIASSFLSNIGLNNINHDVTIRGDAEIGQYKTKVTIPESSSNDEDGNPHDPVSPTELNDKINRVFIQDYVEKAIENYKVSHPRVDSDFTFKLVIQNVPKSVQVQDGYIFTDNSGNVKSVSGNTVNVVLIKPQNVDPATDARMRATATRTIQINFPGTIPPSYKNIVNDKGELIQTVTFTRTGQEDALTGDLIDNTLTPWKSDNKDHNFIGFEARTLPRIPGYTLSIKPA